jgi:hypothetical protein
MMGPERRRHAAYLLAYSPLWLALRHASRDHVREALIIRVLETRVAAPGACNQTPAGRERAGFVRGPSWALRGRNLPGWKRSN